jgi:hypothetical protein
VYTEEHDESGVVDVERAASRRVQEEEEEGQELYGAEKQCNRERGHSSHTEYVSIASA